MNKMMTDVWISLKKRDTFSDRTIRQIVFKKYHIELAALPNTKPETQQKVLKYLKELNGCSVRQLARLTRLNVYQIVRG
jgi:putative transposase